MFVKNRISGRLTTLKVVPLPASAQPCNGFIEVMISHSHGIED